MDITALVFVIVILVIILATTVQIDRIFRYRMSLLDAVNIKNLEEIAKQGDKFNEAKASQRYQTVVNVSETQMVFKFWRKPSSFYDPAFLKEIGK